MVGLLGSIWSLQYTVVHLALCSIYMNKVTMTVNCCVSSTSRTALCVVMVDLEVIAESLCLRADSFRASFRKLQTLQQQHRQPLPQ